MRAGIIAALAAAVIGGTVNTAGGGLWSGATMFPIIAEETEVQNKVISTYSDECGNFCFWDYAKAIGAQLRTENYCYRCGAQSVQGEREIIVRNMIVVLPTGAEVTFSVTYDPAVGAQCSFISDKLEENVNNYHNLRDYGYDNDTLLQDLVWDTNGLFVTDQDGLAEFIAETSYLLL